MFLGKTLLQAHFIVLLCKQTFHHALVPNCDAHVREGNGLISPESYFVVVQGSLRKLNAKLIFHGLLQISWAYVLKLLIKL